MSSGRSARRLERPPGRDPRQRRSHRRRHPGQHYPPLRSAEPQPVTGAQHDELTLPAGQPIPEMGQWIKDLAATHRRFAGTLAERQSLTVPSEDPDYGNLGQAFPPWPRPASDAILQPPKPEIRPSPQVLQRVADRDADPEAADLPVPRRILGSGGDCCRSLRMSVAASLPVSVCMM
jgi:hypothetical protein